MKWSMRTLFAALCGTIVMLGAFATTAPVYAQEGAFAGKSLFVNISSGRVDRALVALRIAGINLAHEAEVAVFFADQAAPFSVKPECLKKKYDKEKLDRKAILVLQEGVEDPTVPSIKGLMYQGVVFYGCPICVDLAIDPKKEVPVGEGEDAVYEKCGELFGPDGSFDPNTWARAVLPGIIPVGPANAAEVFALLYDEYNENGEQIIDASVISF